jgi:hypothetical protein
MFGDANIKMKLTANQGDHSIRFIYIFLVKSYGMSFKRIYQDVEGVSCPLCGASVLKDARNTKNVKYFCSGTTIHDLNNNKIIKAYLKSEK